MVILTIFARMIELIVVFNVYIVMHFTDERISKTNETLNGIKFIKYYNWENSFKDGVESAREKELGVFKSLQYLRATGNFFE
jgi:hypothetical protein